MQRASRPQNALARALLAAFAAALATGCVTRPVPIFEEGGIKVFLRADVRWMTTVAKGYSHPATIAPVRLAHILSRIDLRPPSGFLISFEGDKQRVPAIQTDALYTIAEGVSKALAAADPNQEVVVMAIRDTKRWGVFDHDFLTSFVAYVRDDRLYVHLSRHDWEIPKTREERTPEPRIGDSPQSFKLYAGTAMSLVSDQAVAIDWRDPVFAHPTRTRVLPSGKVERREVLMESPAEVDDTKGDPAMKLPENLSPEQLRGLADIEEARRAGKITETEYRARRRAIIGGEPGG
jgi:hypothetical protein